MPSCPIYSIIAYWVSLRALSRPLRRFTILYTSEIDALKGERNARQLQFYMHYMYTNHKFTLASFSTEVDRKIKRLFNCCVEKGITPEASSGR